MLVRDDEVETNVKVIKAEQEIIETELVMVRVLGNFFARVNFKNFILDGGGAV